MSTLTKVFAILVSIMAIFLCGVVVTFLANVQDWKSSFDEQKTIAEAAQVQALAAQERMTKDRQEQEKIIARLQENVSTLQKLVDDRTRELAAAKELSATDASRADTAVQTMSVMRQTVQNMQDGQQKLMFALDDARKKMVDAQTQVVDLGRNLNSEKALSAQLESTRKRNLEKIHALEEETAQLQQKMKTSTVASSEFEGNGKVSLVTPQVSQVPIRAQITDVQDDRAAISVGTSSGVRKGMRFWIVRGQEFLGNMEIVYVEPDAAVGRLTNKQGVVVKGDAVTTDLE